MKLLLNSIYQVALVFAMAAVTLHSFGPQLAVRVTTQQVK